MLAMARARLLSGVASVGMPQPSVPYAYSSACSPLTHFTKTTGPILFLTGDLDNPDRDKAGIEKLQSLGVPTNIAVRKAIPTASFPRDDWPMPKKK